MEWPFYRSNARRSAHEHGVAEGVEKVALSNGIGIGRKDVLPAADGAGTFKPVTADDTDDHVLHPEEIAIPAATRAAVARARKESRRVIAVGTTVARSLEAAALREDTGPGVDLRFATDLFIKPGFEFRAIDGLLTNFHLPQSTLLMLVCAFAGRERILAAYADAIREGYVFYSFGDAMLVA